MNLNCWPLSLSLYNHFIETVYPMDNPQSAPSYIQDIWDTANLDAIKAMESHWALYPYH